MNILTATKSVLKNYAKFSGRASRSEFWYWALAQLLFLLILYIVILCIAPGLFPWVNLVFSLLLIVPNLAVQYRRLQDCNMHGAWSLIAYVGNLYISILNIVGLRLNLQGDVSLIVVYYEYLHSTPIVILHSVLAAYLIFIFVKNCTRGTDGDNKYGPEPED